MTPISFLRGRNQPLLWREIPVRHGTVSQISSDEHIDAADNVPHHTIPDNYDLLEPAQNVADLLGREPTHVAAPGHVRRVVADAPAPGHGLEHVLACLAERRKGQVEVQAADVAGLAVFVVCEGVDAVGDAVVCIFGRLKGDVGDYCLVGEDFRGEEIGGSLALGRWVSVPLDFSLELGKGEIDAVVLP